MVCPSQAFPWFWNVSAIIVLFSVAKIWDRYAVLCILASGLLQKQKCCPSLEVWQGAPTLTGRFSAFPKLHKLQVSEKLLVALAQCGGACRCSLIWLMLI